MLKIPSVGSTVRANLRFKNINLLDNREWSDVLLTGVVIKNAKWVGANSFSLQTNNKEFPLSIINMKNVTHIDLLKGSMTNIRKFRVKGTNEYIVTLADNHFSCECVGFKYHGKCRHISQVKTKLEMK
jgi:hypothetical protein